MITAAEIAGQIDTMDNRMLAMVPQLSHVLGRIDG